MFFRPVGPQLSAWSFLEIALPFHGSFLSSRFVHFPASITAGFSMAVRTRHRTRECLQALHFISLRQGIDQNPKSPFIGPDFF